MNFRLRSADPDRDGEGCAAIYAPYVATAISFEEQAPNGEQMAGMMRAVQRNHVWQVAEAQQFPGRLAGFAYAAAHRERAAYRWAVDVTIYIAEQFQRQGLGSILYGSLLPELSRRGYRTACAGITLPNAASVALHESCGFRHIGTFRRIGFKAGAWRDVGWWQLHLGNPDDQEPPAEPGA